MTLIKTGQPTDNRPPYRKLRGYAFDPSLSLQLETARVNNITYKVEWEELYLYPGHDRRTVPIGEYIEIIDYDPATGVFYDPVDLNDQSLLAQDGLNPSVSSPQFHQQMVYAVIMTTIKNFEKALGRKVQWARRFEPAPTDSSKVKQSHFVERLRVHPHALRQANAYYDPEKKALLFGYFQARPAQPHLQLPGSTVFTCLSHDVIAHETTHAILDGLQRLYIQDTHPDTRAFHEAFADIVALFQHFTFPEVLKHQIAKTRGDLAAQNLLGQLAQEFGKAIGHYGSLRDAIGHTNEMGEWVAHEPNPAEYATKMEFHDRGAILVAAIFDAFLRIYRNRIKKYLRVASNGTGILAAGDLHPDMVELLANTAAETAGTVLRICVRAIDYCPPVDITFGDYLRALITADVDMVADDEHNYRVAFIEAFQKRGIYPAGIKSMSEEALMFKRYPELEMPKEHEQIFTDFFRKYKESIAYQTDRETMSNITRDAIKGNSGLHALLGKKFIQSPSGKAFSKLTGMLFEPDSKKCQGLGLGYSHFSKTAKYSVEKMSLANRVSPDGRIVNHVVVTLSQRRGVNATINKNGEFSIKGFFQPEELSKHPKGFIFTGGSTLIFDLDTMKLKYAISKGIDDMCRLEYQYRYNHAQLNGEGAATYFDNNMMARLAGPFAFMHANIHHH